MTLAGYGICNARPGVDEKEFSVLVPGRISSEVLEVVAKKDAVV